MVVVVAGISVALDIGDVVVVIGPVVESSPVVLDISVAEVEEVDGDTVEELRAALSAYDRL